MSYGAEDGRAQGHSVRLILVSIFGLLVIVGFAGILWTVRGAPGHTYYWSLRLPITACVLIGWTGLVFSMFPFLSNLAKRSTRAARIPEPSHRELEARAKEVCSLLPMVESATWKTKLSLCLILAGSICCAWWGLRTARPVLAIIGSIAGVIFLWQFARALVFRVEFSSDHIRFRTFRGSQSRRYADVLDVGPGYNANEIRVLFTDNTKLAVYADSLKAADILLIFTERRLAEPPH